MKELLIFIFGIVFATVLMPILDAIGTWVQNIFGKGSIKLQVEAEKIQKSTEEEEIQKQPMGFHMPESEEIEEENWEEEE